MALEPTEFLGRFCLHILPPKFMKIRHYGILSSHTKAKLRMQQMKMGMIVQPRLNCLSKVCPKMLEKLNSEILKAKVNRKIIFVMSVVFLRLPVTFSRFAFGRY
jgi:hypothetical protein